MWAIFGRADGAPFDAEEFLRLHPQWNWQERTSLQPPVATLDGIPGGIAAATAMPFYFSSCTG